MKVFMLGWEFPPHISGGLGTACHGLTKGLDEIGVEVSFVLPQSVPLDTSSHVTIRCPDSLDLFDTPPQTPNAQQTPNALRATAGTYKAGVSREVSEIIAETSVKNQPESLESTFRHLSIHRVPALLQAYGTSMSFREELTSLMTRAHAGELPEELAKIVTQAVKFTEQSHWPADDDIESSPTDDQSARGDVEDLEDFKGGQADHYDGDLIGQIHRYARLAVELSKHEEFDVIHAHDWMTYIAGQAVAARSSKPLVVHVHSTEFDRSGENVNQIVYDIERAGMHAAACVICVSHLTQSIVVNRYGVDKAKTDVVYNAVDLEMNQQQLRPITHKEKIVLFLGRVTMQKGPEYFLQAARKVVDKYPLVRFVMAGSGDMVRQCIRLAADLKLGSHVTFTGFLRGQNVGKIFSMADLYVMPSVSEPFGIAPLEAISHNVPVIISKQSGVSEVLTHVLKVDFWDVDEMANKILAVLRHKPLQKTLRQHGQIELAKLSWQDSAKQLNKIYMQVVSTHQQR